MTAIRQDLPSAIAIAGDGVLSLFAALALRRTVPRVRIVLIPPSRSDAASRELEPVIFPQALAVLERRLGIGPEALARMDGFRRSLLEPLSGSIDAAGPACPLEEVGEPFFGVPFHQLWLDNHRTGRGDAWIDHSRNAAAHRLQSVDAKVREWPDLDWAVRFDQNTMTTWLSQQAARQGIKRTAASARIVDREDRAFREAIVTDDGVTHRADLFVDCQQTAIARFEGNVVTLPLPAGPTSPDANLGLTHALLALDILIALFPARSPTMTGCAEFNRRAGRLAEHVMALAALSALVAGPAPADGSEPATLAQRKLAQFRQRGSITPTEGDPFPPGLWTSYLILLGVRPARRALTAAAIDPAERDAFLAAHAAKVRAENAGSDSR